MAAAVRAAATAARATSAASGWSGVADHSVPRWPRRWAITTRNGEWSTTYKASAAAMKGTATRRMWLTSYLAAARRDLPAHGRHAPDFRDRVAPHSVG